MSKVEPVQVKLWDMRVCAAARVLEKGTQGGLINKVKNSQGGRNWQDHALTWAAAATQENGERQIDWDFPWERKQIHSLYTGDVGTKDTLQK